MGQRVREYCLAVPLIPMAGVRHHVLDDAVRPAAARQVGDDGECTTGNQRIANIASEDAVMGIGQDLLPCILDDCAGRKRVILAVKMRVEREQIVQVAGVKRSNRHGVARISENGSCGTLSFTANG